MKKIINKPIAETFGWLHAGGTAVDLPEEPEQRGVFACSRRDEDSGRWRPYVPYTEIRAELSEGASLHFIEVKSPDGPEKTYADIHAVCGKDAHFCWTRLLFDGRRPATTARRSSPARGAPSGRISATGCPPTISTMSTAKRFTRESARRAGSSRGVPADEADKLLRGTIDFRNGCAGAVGNESEEVLLLSENIRNRSVPVILCDEEDVVGNHGASIGRPDEELLYYMESRGLRADEAVELLAAAKLAAVVNRIPDEKIREEIREKYL